MGGYANACIGSGKEFHMVFINEIRHGLWVQLRRRSELQQVVRVVEFLPQVPQHLFFAWACKARHWYVSKWSLNRAVDAVH